MGSTRISHRHLFGSGTLAALIALTQGAAALGEPIRYEYGGVITSADDAPYVMAGTRFEGSLTYDPAVSPLTMWTEGMKQYAYGHSNSFPGTGPDGSGLDLRVPGQTLLGDPGGLNLAVYESGYPGQFAFHDTQGNPLSFTRVNISNGDVDQGSILVQLSLENPDRAVLGSLNPPTTLDLADFPKARLSVFKSSEPSVKLYEGTIDHLEAVPVPESTTLATFGVAIASWAVRLRRRRDG